MIKFRPGPTVGGVAAGAVLRGGDVVRPLAGRFAAIVTTRAAPDDPGMIEPHRVPT